MDGKKVSLRQVLLQDYEQFWAALSDNEFRRAVPGSEGIKTIDGAKAAIVEWIVRNQRGEELHRSVCLEDGRMVGMVALYSFSANSAKIGYWISKDQWGKGYGTRAVAILLKIAFEELGMEKVYASTERENVASVKLLARLGFREIGGSAKEAEFELLKAA